MTSQPARSRQSESGAATTPRVQINGVQRLANYLVRGLLRAPLLSRAAGRRLVTLYVVGRTSGRRYTIPVAYTRDGSDLLIGTPFGWGRNLRTGEPLQIRFKGRRREADVQVYTDEPGVTGLYAAMCRDNRTFAGFNKIGFDDAGNPLARDLHLAWRAGARGFRLTPR
jgi:hypothetical protein